MDGGVVGDSVHRRHSDQEQTRGAAPPLPLLPHSDREVVECGGGDDGGLLRCQCFRCCRGNETARSGRGHRSDGL